MAKKHSFCFFDNHSESSVEKTRHSFFVWPTPQELTSGAGHLALSPPLSLATHMVIYGEKPSVGDPAWLPAAARQAAEVLNQAAGGTGPAVVEGAGGLLNLLSQLRISELALLPKQMSINSNKENLPLH